MEKKMTEIQKKAALQKLYCNNHHVPNFAGSGGCYHCGRNVFGEGGLTAKDAISMHVTGCPFCHTSFCE